MSHFLLMETRLVSHITYYFPVLPLLFPIESIWQSIFAIYKTPKWADNQREKRLFEVTIHKVFQCSLLPHNLSHASLILLIKTNLNVHTISQIFHPLARCCSFKTWNMLLLQSYKLLFTLTFHSRAIFLCWVMAPDLQTGISSSSHSCLSASWLIPQEKTFSGSW